MITESHLCRGHFTYDLPALGSHDGLEHVDNLVDHVQSPVACDQPEEVGCDLIEVVLLGDLQESALLDGALDRGVEEVVAGLLVAGQHALELEELLLDVVELLGLGCGGVQGRGVLAVGAEDLDRGSNHGGGGAHAAHLSENERTKMKWNESGCQTGSQIIV